MKKQKNKDIGLALTEKLTVYLSRLSPVELIGVATILCVPVVNYVSKEPENFVTIWSSIVDKFYHLSLKKKKEYLKIIKDASEVPNGAK